MTLKNNLILAPLAGYTDIAFRRLCLECGAGLAVTEMVSVKGLNYKNRQTFAMLRTSEAEKVSCVQLFGSDPEDFRRALESGALDKFDIIDVNMGCPVAKVVRNGEGSALLHRPEVAAAIVRVLAESKKPVTVKMRSGFCDGEDIAVPFALEMQRAGAAMVTVHARTTAQLYSGRADFSIVRRVKEALDIPVAISGDIVSPETFAERADCADAYMIGRGALMNPNIFSLLQCGKMQEVSGGETQEVHGGELQEAPSGELRDKYSLIKRHIEYLSEYFDEHYAVVTLRKFFAYYLKGEKGTKELKNSLMSATSLELVNKLLYNFFVTFLGKK